MMNVKLWFIAGASFLCATVDANNNMPDDSSLQSATDIPTLTIIGEATLEVSDQNQPRMIEAMITEMLEQKKIIGVMQTELSQQKKQNNAMQTELSRQRKQNDAMQTELSEQRKQNDAIQIELSEQRKQNDAVKSVMLKQKNDIDEMQSKILLQKKQLDDMHLKSITHEEHINVKKKDNISEHIQGISNLHSRQAENEMTVAFYARAKQNLLNLGAAQPVVFEDVETNIGHAYLPHQGAFIAPVAGVYVFSSSIERYGDVSVNCHFSVNGVNKGKFYVQGSTGDRGSLTVVLQLKQGDDVAILNERPGAELFGDGFTTFSGFLLQQDYQTAIVG